MSSYLFQNIALQCIPYLKVLKTFKSNATLKSFTNLINIIFFMFQ